MDRNLLSSVNCCATLTVFITFSCCDNNRKKIEENPVILLQRLHFTVKIFCKLTVRFERKNSLLKKIRRPKTDRHVFSILPRRLVKIDFLNIQDATGIPSQTPLLFLTRQEFCRFQALILLNFPMRNRSISGSKSEPGKDRTQLPFRWGTSGLRMRN